MTGTWGGMWIKFRTTFVFTIVQWDSLVTVASHCRAKENKGNFNAHPPELPLLLPAPTMTLANTLLSLLAVCGGEIGVEGVGGVSTRGVSGSVSSAIRDGACRIDGSGWGTFERRTLMPGERSEMPSHCRGCRGGAEASGVRRVRWANRGKIRSRQRQQG